jgi:hypothetical protein
MNYLGLKRVRVNKSCGYLAGIKRNEGDRAIYKTDSYSYYEVLIN